MATKSVTTATQDHFFLPFDKINRGDELCSKLAGLVECLNAASLSPEPPAGKEIANVCWIASDLVAELREIVNARSGATA